MTILRVSGFGGIIPRLGKRLLPDNNAQYALNSQLFSGELRSWNQPKLIIKFPTVPDLQDVYHYRHKDGTDHYIPFTSRHDVVKAPIINDAFGRLYWTDGTGMYTTTQSDVEAGIAPVLTGVPAPVFGTTPTVVATGGTTANAVTRVYNFILVTKYGEEGAPAVNSTITTSGNSDGTWTIAHMNSLVASGNPNVISLRMYRTISTTTNVTFREVVEWPLASIPATYVDVMPETTLAVQPAQQSLSWTQPPLNAVGLCSGPNGMLSLFVNRTVYFSVPFFPHAWPNEYQLAVEDDIVAIAWVGTMLVIGTKGRPAVVQGSSPTSLTLQKFGEVIPCLSANSFVPTSVAVFYASLDGLMSISPDNGVQNVTNAFCSRNDWLERFPPAGMSGAIYQQRYFGFYSSQLGFSLGFDDATTGLTDLQFDGVKRIKNGAVDNSAHLIVGDSLYQWDSGDDPLLYVWRTKPFITPKPLNLGVLQVRGDFLPSSAPPPAPAPQTNVPNKGFGVNELAIDEGPINGYGGNAPLPGSDTIGIKLYGNGKLRWAGAIRSETPVRLPSGYKADTWEVEVSGSLSVFSVVVAETASELDQTP